MIKAKLNAMAVATMALLLAAACGETRREPTEKSTEKSTDTGEAYKPGRCKNEDVKGPCKFIGSMRQNEGPETFVAGTAVHRIDFQILTGDREIVVTLGYFRVSESKANALIEYYEKNSPAKCEAYIVWPPCNPQGTTVSIDIEPPPFATPVRF